MRSASHLPRTGRARAAALLVLLLAALFAAGCGSDDDSSTTPVPSGTGGSDAVVVQADGQAITKAQFDRALRSRLTGISPLAPAGGAAVVLDPPDYERCIAASRKQLRAAGVSSTPTRKMLKANCAAQERQARAQVLSTLIQQAWVAQQAEEAGVKAPAAAIASTLAAARKQPGFAQRLKRSGQTLEDVRTAIATQLLTAALVQKATTSTAPTNAQARRFLKEHPELFGTPARRKVDVVATASAAEAKQAKAALKKGQAVRDVIAGLGQSSVRQGRITLTDGDGQLSPAVQKAVSAARRGTVAGPVKVGDLYYVVAVRSVRPAKVPSFAKVADKARQLYVSFQAQNAQNTLQAQMKKAWGAKTACAKGYAAPECANAPAGASTTTTTG